MSNIQYNKSVQASSMEIRGNDFYETPWQATRALVYNTNLNGLIYEPCYGKGAIVDELKQSLKKNILKFITSDIVCHDPNNPPDVVKDFLKIQPSDFPKNTLDKYTIITNPPYGNKLPQKMINHGLTLVPRMYLLLRLPFLEGSSIERNRALSHCKRIFVFKNRLPRMHRDGYNGPKTTSLLAFGWFEFDRNTYNKIEVERIEWFKQWVK